MTDMEMTEHQIYDAFHAAAADGCPVILLDNRRVCLISGCRDRLAVSECVDEHVATLSQRSGGCYEGTFCRHGHMYCIRYMAIGGLYIGEILGTNEVSFLADLTDGVGNHVTAYGTMEHELAKAWEKQRDLDRLLLDSSPEVRELMRELESSLYRVSANNRNVYEYLNMLRATGRRVAVDMAKLCRELACRCNEALRPTGRSIEYKVPMEERIFIRADVRHAVAALLNAMQNALMYSPKDSVPFVEVKSGGRKLFVIIQNERKYRDDATAVYTLRNGYGIPMIRRFVSITGGELTLDLESSTASVVMSIPMISAQEIAEYALEETGLYKYQGAGPDYVELQMLQVADMYRDEEKTANVQYSVT